MKTIKKIFVYLFFGLSFLLHGQQIGNYVANGSFESLYTCITQPSILKTKGWSCIDSSQYCAPILHKCWGNVPVNGVGYQNPKDGEAYARLSLWCPICPSPSSRSNIKNRLKKTLDLGKTYCVKMYVSCQDLCPQAISDFGFYFGDASIDTIIYNARRPLTFLSPQVLNPTTNFITDSMNWIPITGTFTSNGTEKYLIVSNFKSDVTTNTITTGYLQGNGFAEYFVDAISCMEVNLSAEAGPDKLIYLGDSTFIGRQPDFATDAGCVWYKLPNMTTSLDTISGIWVKPTTTSTYVVRQVLDCSPLKWDTVVVTINTNLVDLAKIQWYSDNIILFPNPTSGNLNISFPSQTDIETYSISNSLGQILREDKIEIINSSYNVLTSDLKNGLYQIHFKTQFGIVTKKFVKTN